MPDTTTPTRAHSRRRWAPAAAAWTMVAALAVALPEWLGPASGWGRPAIRHGLWHTGFFFALGWAANGLLCAVFAHASRPARGQGAGGRGQGRGHTCLAPFDFAQGRLRPKPEARSLPPSPVPRSGRRVGGPTLAALLCASQWLIAAGIVATAGSAPRGMLLAAAAAAALCWVLPAAAWGRGRFGVGRATAVLIAVLTGALCALAFAFSLLRGTGGLLPLQVHPVLTPSMEPTIHGAPDDGDWVLVDRWAYDRADPRRFDVALLVSPLDPDRRYLKRVVGLPGERLRLADDVVFINGVAAAGPAGLRFPGSGSGPLCDGCELAIPAERYIVLGDFAGMGAGAPHSFDSRHWQADVYHLTDGGTLATDPDAPRRLGSRGVQVRGVDGRWRVLAHEDSTYHRLEAQPFVPRGHLLGRAVSRVWPRARWAGLGELSD